jgi:hypothetical protein
MPVLSAARLLLSWVEILACRARPSNHWNSNRQIEANRMNTKPSTGPKTAAGKEQASGNALRHGQTGDKRGLFGSDAFGSQPKRRTTLTIEVSISCHTLALSPSTSRT